LTIGGTWAALQPRSAPHEAHGHDEHHGDEEHEEKEEPAEEEDKPEESSEGGDESKEGGDEAPTEESSDTDDKPKEDAAAEAKSEGTGEAETPSNKGKTLNKSDTKKSESGGQGDKKRIDSDNAKNIGEGVSSKTGDDMSDKQSGLSNTDTAHSTDPNKDETKSSKGEGTAETAKVKGTVQTDRPQV
jgi:hypothetical protein